MPWWKKPTQAELDAKREEQRVADEKTRLAEQAEEERNIAKASADIREMFAKNSANGERFVDIRDNDEIPGTLEKFLDLILELANEKRSEVETVHFYDMGRHGPRGAILTLKQSV
jgi:hypothetical protein